MERRERRKYREETENGEKREKEKKKWSEKKKEAHILTINFNFTDRKKKEGSRFNDQFWFYRWKEEGGLAFQVNLCEEEVDSNKAIYILN